MERWGLIVSLVLNVIMILGAFTGGFKKVLRWFKEHSSTRDTIIPIPKQTLRIIPHPHPRSLWWHMGSRGEAPVMQIVGDFLVTNVTKLNVMVPAVKLKKPPTLGFAIVRKSSSDIYGQFPILPGGTSDLQFTIWVDPPMQEKEKIVRGDIALVDQFGNEHWMKNLEFKYSGNK